MGLATVLFLGTAFGADGCTAQSVVEDSDVDVAQTAPVSSLEPAPHPKSKVKRSKGAGAADRPRSSKAAQRRRHGGRRNAGDKATLMIRGLADGSIEVYTAGVLAETYPPGSLVLHGPSPGAQERITRVREERKQREEEWAKQRAQAREENAQAAEEAALKRDEEEKVRKAAERKAALADKAMRVQDLRTGKFVMAIPVWRLPGLEKAEGKKEADKEKQTKVLFDAMGRRWVKAIPLDAFDN